MNLRQAAQQALQAIESGESFNHFDGVVAPLLRAALAEPEQGPEQQPVAHSVVEPLRPDEYQCRVSVKWVGQPVSGPLYTAPTPRKPLTDEEIINIGKEARAVEGPHILPVSFARAIERAHGIGEQHE